MLVCSYVHNIKRYEWDFNNVVGCHEKDSQLVIHMFEYAWDSFEVFQSQGANVIPALNLRWFVCNFFVAACYMVF